MGKIFVSLTGHQLPIEMTLLFQKKYSVHHFDPIADNFAVEFNFHGQKVDLNKLFNPNNRDGFFDFPDDLNQTMKNACDNPEAVTAYWVYGDNTEKRNSKKELKKVIISFDDDEHGFNGNEKIKLNKKQIKKSLIKVVDNFSQGLSLRELNYEVEFDENLQSYLIVIDVPEEVKPVED
jgi:hypothetical protein